MSAPISPPEPVGHGYDESTRLEVLEVAFGVVASVPKVPNATPPAVVYDGSVFDIEHVTPAGASYDPNSALAADLFACVKPHLPDGDHDLTVTRIECRGDSILMHVEDASGATAQVTLGKPGASRNKRLRLLLGRSDFGGLDEIRAALQSQHLRVRLTTYAFGQPGRAREFRGIERAWS